jgi:hypothetical protein
VGAGGIQLAICGQEPEIFCADFVPDRIIPLVNGGILRGKLRVAGDYVRNTSAWPRMSESSLGDGGSAVGL